MNLIALIAAVIGVSLMATTVIYGNKIGNKWLRYAAAFGGVVISFLIMSNIPVLFGDDSIETATQAGSYLVVLIVVAAIFKAIFFRKKKDE